MLKTVALSLYVSAGALPRLSPAQQFLIQAEKYEPKLFKLANPAKVSIEDVLCGYTIISFDASSRLPDRSGGHGGGHGPYMLNTYEAVVVAQPPLKVFVQSRVLNVHCAVNQSLKSYGNLEELEKFTVAAVKFESCFPARATVRTPAGPKSIAELKVGDRVLAVRDPATGATTYDEVFLTPHRDSSSFATYLNLHIVAQDKQVAPRTLTLSPRHYVPTACQPNSRRQCLKHAGDVAVGDQVWLQPEDVGDQQQVVLGTVAWVTVSYEQGLYSPWTLTGSLVVDGVAASTHTAWPGEAALLQMLPKSNAANAAHLLAAAHQIVQTPLRD
eukprot:gene9577-9739_t